MGSGYLKARKKGWFQLELFLREPSTLLEMAALHAVLKRMGNQPLEPPVHMEPHVGGTRNGPFLLATASSVPFSCSGRNMTPVFLGWWLPWLLFFRHVSWLPSFSLLDPFSVWGFAFDTLKARHLKRGIRSSHLLKSICCFPLLVLKGIYHYWQYIYIYYLFIFSRGLNQLEETGQPRFFSSPLRFGSLSPGGAEGQGEGQGGAAEGGEGAERSERSDWSDRSGADADGAQKHGAK